MPSGLSISLSLCRGFMWGSTGARFARLENHKRSRHDARVQCSSLTETSSTSNTPGTPSEMPSHTQMPSASPGISRCPTPSPSPILAPDSMTQPIASWWVWVWEAAAMYNPFPGPYHPDYLSQNWVPPSMAGMSSGTNKALLFSGVDSIDGEVGSNASSSNTSPNSSTASNVTNNSTSTTANANSPKKCRSDKHSKKTKQLCIEDSDEIIQDAIHRVFADGWADAPDDDILQDNAVAGPSHIADDDVLLPEHNAVDPPPPVVSQHSGRTI
ncbi:uncharacterized protein EDB93DRAFT_1310501 [Suillus bovinus]|uniref:uncharacterized protein n=1 Tax=Suillus bovinus TaxID=48563 RepID=UPI001B886F1F|nr:uncharacterized protein EDB93DRAFT_1310501 [Suillus bovinus]KAG2156561.1 hypothetical protein EDB93DRAFT_1310501 [Suillus bovinus]